jgi:ParB family chromosome partitioning protein
MIKTEIAQKNTDDNGKLAVNEIKIGERIRKDLGDLSSLIQSIKEIGLLHPVVINEENCLIAGYRRIEAVKQLGWSQVPVTIVPLKELLKGEVQENLVRKNFTSSERATIAKIMMPEITIEAKGRQGTRTDLGQPCADSARSRDVISTFAGVSHDTLAKDVFIDNAVEKYPDKVKPIQEAIDNGDLTVNAGYVKTKAIIGFEEIKQSKLPEIPEGKFRTIIIDPPWPIQKIEREVRPNQTETLDYPTMSLEEIANLPIGAKADLEGCHVYLWVTHRFLPDAFDLFLKWGVKYECLLTWVKPVGFTPFSWMYNTEHVLFGRIGTLKLLKFGIKLSFNSSSNRHSEKPDIFYENVKNVSPEPRLAMFERKQRDGFIVWGNEIEQ